MFKNLINQYVYRSNVAIVIVNKYNKVFLARRIKEHTWQFPQGGIKYKESIEKAMYRELLEEVGLLPKDIQIIAKTKKWLYYNIPDNLTSQFNKEYKITYKGQKQIWYLLRLITQDTNINLNTTNNPEFDAWKWTEYWEVIDEIVDFKKNTYLFALHELSNFLPIINSYKI